jgi:glycine betaine/proline transport system permease protein
MQTMPAYVYLIPVIPFFGLGAVTAIMATIIFSIPPVIRLTCLGIDQISEEYVEAADAFGSSTWQKLCKVQLPLARQTILGGINQGIMLSLSMVVLSALVGAKGLGCIVWRAIQRLDMGLGFEAGLAVVVLAIILDRLTKQIAIKGTPHVP